MNLSEKQRKFSILMARLLLELDARGYEITMGECWRPPEMAKIYAADGRGVASSLHCIRLGVDLNLFKDGRYLVKNEEYKEAGEIWESYSTDEYTCSWGGSFGDSGHFSITHGGVR